MDDWEHMLNFGLALVTQAKEHLQNTPTDDHKRIVSERIAILHLNHANELFMKSFLIRNGYTIEYIERSDVKKGLKKREIFNKSKTLEYYECLELVIKTISLDNNEKKSLSESLMKLYKIRNEIQHRALNLPLDKFEEIRNFYPSFKKLYTLMFPHHTTQLPEID